MRGTVFCLAAHHNQEPMKTTKKHAISSCLCLALGLVLAGCGKSQPSAKPSAKADPNALSVSNALAALREAGQPLTLEALQAWYPEPPEAENAASLYAEAFAALSKDDPKAPTFLSGNRRALELLLRAAERTSCRYPVDLNGGYSAQLPHLAKVRTCGVLLKAEAVAQAARGRADLAAGTVLAGLRLARSLEKEPLIISQLVRFAVEKETLDGLEQVLTSRPFPEAQLIRLQAALREASPSNGLHRALVGERCACVSAFRMAAEDQAKLVNQSAGSANPAQAAPAGALTAYRNSPTYLEDFVFALDFFSNMVAATELPFPASLTAAADAAAQLDSVKTRGFLLSGLLLPTTGRLFTKAAEAAARLRVSDTALAVERHRLKPAAGLPVTLDALAPDLLKAVPLDPFDGKPLRFEKLAGKGYVVYSVGQDQRDDHGASPADLAFTVKR